MKPHPAATLRHDQAQIHLEWTGDVVIAPSAEIVDPDGADTDVRHGHRYVIHHDDPRWPTLMAILRPAFEEHYAALGLRAPSYEEGHLPLHLHPQGHPGLTPHPSPVALEAVDADHTARVRAALVAAKERELGVPIPLSAYPLPAPLSVPDSAHARGLPALEMAPPPPIPRLPDLQGGL